MKKIISFCVAGLMSVLMTGCEMSKETKVVLLTQSVRLAAVSGVRVAVVNKPELKDIFILTADLIDKVIDASNSPVNLEESIKSNLSKEVDPKYSEVVSLSVSESVTLLSSILEANKALIGDDYKSIQSISKGLTSGIRMAVQGQSVGVSPQQLEYLKL